MEDHMTKLRGILTGAALAAVTAAALVPGAAKAWWVRGGVFVAAPPVVVAAPAITVAAPVYPAYGYHWIPAHYNRFGYWMAGHWGY